MPLVASIGVASARGFGFSLSTGFTGTISYTLGTGGSAGFDAANGSTGGNSTLSYSGVSLTANGGSGGLYNADTNSNGGTASGGTSNATGGTGGGVSGDRGGGGGGGINGGNSDIWFSSNGQTGANAVDFQSLSAALSGSGFSLGTGGAGAPSGAAPGNDWNGSPGSGIGGGGGGAGYYGGAGGAGSFGGGGGGAAGYTASVTGGTGGQGVLIIRRNDTTTTVLTSGTSYSIPAGTTSIKVWLIGAGGGGAGSPQSDGTSGGAGAAGGIAYYAWL
jgi:hypothetical protein